MCFKMNEFKFRRYEYLSQNFYGKHPHLRLEPPDGFYAYFTGDNFFITCFSDPSSEATRLTWQTPAGRDITNTKGRVHVEPSPNNILGLQLVVEEVRHRDQGNFTCSAVVDGRETRLQFALKVYLSLNFWDTEEEQIGVEGSDFMIMCCVRSEPEPIVSWYVNGSLIMDGPRRTILEDGLLVRNLKTSDAGNYTCRAMVVTPHKSQMQDQNIEVHVHYKPVWTDKDVDTFYGVVGAAANLTCEAESEPRPIFEWFRGRTLLGNSNIYSVINKKYRSILEVKINSLSNLGEYLCLVSNSVGEIKKEMYLLEGVSPHEPNFLLSSPEPGVLGVQIHQSPLDTLPLVGYKIQWKLATDSWGYAREYSTSAGTDFLIQDLNFDMTYAVRVSAQNSIGFSEFTDPKLQRTKGLIAETVVDGGNVLSSTFSESSTTSSLNHPVFYLVLAISIIFFHKSYTAS